MPLPLIPLISAGASLLGNVFNGIFNKSNNDQQQSFASDMYNRQRADALADRAFENEYNSPAAQMERLTKAGLNPNLVYGGGNPAVQSVHTNQASTSNPSTRPTQIDTSQFAESLMLAAQVKKLNAEARLTEEQIKNQQYIRDNYDATIRNKDVSTQLNQVQLAVQNALSADGVQVSQAKANLQKTLDQSKVMLNEADQKVIQTSSNIKEAAARISMIKLNGAKSVAEQQRIMQATKYIQEQIKIMQPDVVAAKMGIAKDSYDWLKFSANVLQQLVDLP